MGSLIIRVGRGCITDGSSQTLVARCVSTSVPLETGLAGQDQAVKSIIAVLDQLFLGADVCRMYGFATAAS